MDSLPNTYLVLQSGRLVPMELNADGIKHLQYAVKRIGGPWENKHKPSEAHIILDRESEGQLPLEVYDILVLGVVGGGD